MLIVAVVAALLLKYVSFFHQAYFIGSNPESARLSGINVTKFVYVLYMIIGFFACAGRYPRYLALRLRAGFSGAGR